MDIGMESRQVSLARATMTIAYEHKALFKINVYDDVSFYELDEKIGGEDEVKSGEEAFDRKFLVFSNRLEQAKRFMESKVVREKIREINKYSFTHIKVNTKVISLEREYVLGHLPYRDLTRFAQLLREFGELLV
jgi:hypothetical protein